VFGDNKGEPPCEDVEGEDEEGEEAEEEAEEELLEEGVLALGDGVGIDSAISGIPFVRYSTALSGLLKAARKAFTTSSFENPISHRFLTIVSYSEPVTNVEAACSVGFDSVGLEVVDGAEVVEGAEVVDGVDTGGVVGVEGVGVEVAGVEVAGGGAVVPAAGFLTISTRKSLSAILCSKTLVGSSKIFPA